MQQIQIGFEQNQNKQKKIRIDQSLIILYTFPNTINANIQYSVKKEIHFNLSTSVDDELAEFIDSFITKNNENNDNQPIVLSKQLEMDRMNFLDSMKEMMLQSANATSHRNNNSNNAMDVDLYNDDDKSDEEWNVEPRNKKKRRTKADGSKRRGRSSLDDKLNNVETKEDWSDAQKKAWRQKASNPNEFYYRFNVSGQLQKKGEWDKAEHKLFMERVLELGVNEKWGLWSKTIPGRIGYCCSNYMKRMREREDVTDLNYYFDKNKGDLAKWKKPKNVDSAIWRQFNRFAFTVYKDPSGTFKNLP